MTGTMTETTQYHDAPESTPSQPTCSSPTQPTDDVPGFPHSLDHYAIPTTPMDNYGMPDRPHPGAPEHLVNYNGREMRDGMPQEEAQS